MWSTSPKSGTDITHIWARKSVYFYDLGYGIDYKLCDMDWAIMLPFMCNLGCTSVEGNRET